MPITVIASPPQLRWSNFRVVDSSPALSGNEVAQVHPEARLPPNVQVDNTRGVYRLRPFTITVGVVIADTLVLSSAAQTADLLKHEQGHFDLLFLTARAMAADLSAATASSAADLGRQVQTIQQTHATRAATLDSTYDTQTSNGSDTNQQNSWNLAITVALGNPAAATVNSMPL